MSIIVIPFLFTNDTHRAKRQEQFNKRICKNRILGLLLITIYRTNWLFKRLVKLFKQPIYTSVALN